MKHKVVSTRSLIVAARDWAEDNRAGKLKADECLVETFEDDAENGLVAIQRNMISAGDVDGLTIGFLHRAGIMAMRGYSATLGKNHAQTQEIQAA